MFLFKLTVVFVSVSVICPFDFIKPTPPLKLRMESLFIFNAITPKSVHSGISIIKAL